MAIDVNPTPPVAYSGTVPDRATATSNEAYANSIFAYLNYFDNTFVTSLTTFSTSLDTWADQLNATEININAKEASAEASADSAIEAKEIAEALVNYKGDWVPNYETIGYPLASSVSYSDGNRYISKVSNNLVEPTAGISTAEWLVVLSVENLISITPAPTLNTHTLSINEYADPVTFTITNYDSINPASYTIVATLGTIVYTTGDTFTYEPPVVIADTADTISIYAVGEGQLRSDTVTVAVTVNDLGVIDGQSIIVTSFTGEFETNDLWEVI